MKDLSLDLYLNQRLIKSLCEYLEMKQRYEDLCALKIEKKASNNEFSSSSILTSFEYKNDESQFNQTLKKIPSDIYSDSGTSQFNY